MQTARNLATVLIVVVPDFAAAQSNVSIHAVRPIPGYVCMALNLSDQQMMDPSIHVPIRIAPSSEAATTGNAIATVIVAWPQREQNGYLQVLQLNGQTGWIRAQFLKPWQNSGGNGQRCYPSVMSNGRVGFYYH
jgi:hypothetical protein